MNCLICKGELGQLEIDCHREWHYDCQICHYCKGAVTEDILRESLEAGRPCSHKNCHENALWASFGNDNILITQEHLDTLNHWLLTTHPLKEGISLETCYKLLRDLEQAAANVAVAISRKKDRIKIVETEAWREHIEIEQENNREKKRIQEEKKIKLQEERADPRLRDRCKETEGLRASFGMTQEQAEEFLRNQEAGIKQ